MYANTMVSFYYHLHPRYILLRRGLFLLNPIIIVIYVQFETSTTHFSFNKIKELNPSFSQKSITIINQILKNCNEKIRQTESYDSRFKSIQVYQNT